MFEKAVALNPDDPMLSGNLGDAYLASGQKDKARTAYERSITLGQKALEANPRNADTMVEIALAAVKVGNASEARKLIHEAREIDTKNIDYLYDEAAIDAQLGKKAEGLKLLQEAFDKGYSLEFAIQDPDLRKLTDTPEFEQLWEEFDQARNARTQNASGNNDSKSK